MSNRSRAQQQSKRSRAMPHVNVTRSRAEVARENREDGVTLQRAAATSKADLALLMDSLRVLAGEEGGARDEREEETRETLHAIEETRALLSTLSTRAPMIARYPDLMEQARGVVSTLSARMTSPEVASTIRDLITQKDSPTHSTPIASGGSAGVEWAGIGNRRTDAQGVANAAYLRRLATSSPWVQAAITTRKQQIGRADVDVLPLDEMAKWAKPTQLTLSGLLNYPNEMRDSYRSLMEPVVDDILTIDRGAISKDLDARGVPHHLYFEDGATIKIFSDWHGEPNKPHYVFQPPNSTEQVPLYNEQLICVQANAASYRYGLSPTQILVDTIRADLAATEKARNLVSDVPPPHLLHLKGASKRTLQGLRADYEQDVMGKRELMLMGFDGDLEVFPLMFSLKDNQFLEWQVYLARKICAVYQISPQQVGITFDINKATSETQQQITEDSGLIPLMLLLEEYLNRELVADFAKTDRDGRPMMDALNLCILYTEISELSRMMHFERVLSSVVEGLKGLPALTPNMALRMMGEEPVSGGNSFWMATKEGPIPYLTYDGDYGDYGNFPGSPGYLGAQTPSGGVNDEETDPKKPEQESQKPSADQNAAALNNEGADGSTPPDSGAANSSENQQPNTAGKGVHTLSHGAPLRAPRYVDPTLVKRHRDSRRPGKAWSASTQETAFLRARMSGVYANATATDRAVLAGKVARPALVRHASSHEEAGDGEHEGEEGENAPKLTPRGRARRGVASGRPTPHGVTQAKGDLRAKAQAIFEEAAKRGQRGA